MTTTDSLRGIPLFATLPEPEIAALHKISNIRTREDGEVIFVEGQPSDCFLVILNGQVEVIKALGMDGEMQLGLVSQGGYLGEVGLFLDNQLRSASVRARGQVRYLEIPRPDFQALLERYPGLAFHIMQEMSQRLRSSENANLRDLRAKNQALQQALEDLKAAQAQLIAQERLEAELALAHKIQHGLLPDEMPDLPGWRFAALWLPAREVSGDFYDFLSLPDGRIGLVIGDVTGKGMPAALVMATTRSVLHAVTRSLLVLQKEQVSPGWLLAQVNDILCPDMPAMMFVTCLLVFLDPSSGDCTFANAGHCLPYLYNRQGARSLRAAGMPLGLMPGMPYDDSQVSLAINDGLLLHSDGLTEAHNPAGEMFGTTLLQAKLAAWAAREPSPGEMLISNLQQEMELFSGSGWEQEDDVTFVTLERL